MLGVFGRFVRTKWPPLVIALLIVVLAGSFITIAPSNVALQAPPTAVVLIVLASTGAFVMRRVLLPDFMRSTKRNRVTKLVIGKIIDGRSRGVFSRYSKPRTSIGRLNTHLHIFSAPTPMRT